MGLYFGTNAHILSNDRDGSGTLCDRVNIPCLPGADSLSIDDILTFQDQGLPIGAGAAGLATALSRIEM